MKINENFASIHSYLCSDGYVIKNPKTQKQKYYCIGFRNYNGILLKDFYDKFYTYFGKKPHFDEGRVRIGSKEIYTLLTNNFGSFYSKDWNLPKLNKPNLSLWLRAYFDCESWVMCRKARDRCIGLDSINQKGLKQIQESLIKFNIPSKFKKVKNRNIFRLYIFGKDNLIRFQKNINYLHPKKKKKLQEAIDSYVDYNWNFKNIKVLLKEKFKVKKPYYLRIISNLKINLEKTSYYLKKEYKIHSKVYKRRNGIGTAYYSLMIQSKIEVEKVLKKGLLPYSYERQIKENLGL